MSGASRRHILIVTNLVRELSTQLKKLDCEVYSTDMRVKVNPTGLYTYPDIQVVCGEPLFADDQKDMVANPTLVVEVLSKSTEAHDRGFKFSQYRKIESLQEYALVSQSEPRVEVFHRGTNQHWVFTDFAGLDAVATFESVNLRLAYGLTITMGTRGPSPGGGFMWS